MKEKPKRLLLFLEISLVGIVIWYFHAGTAAPPSKVPELAWPDSVHYSIGAWNLAKGNGYSIMLNGERLPPKYPPGTSLLLAIYYSLSGNRREAGIYLMQLMSVLAILFTWLASRKAGGTAGGIAALIGTMTGSSILIYRNMIYSEIPALWAGAFLLFLVVYMKKGWPRALVLGLVAGFAVVIRYSMAILFPPMLLLFMLEKEKPLRNLALFSLASAVPLGLLAWWHMRAFGSPFRTGYSLWLPRMHEGGFPVFSLSYALHGPYIPAGNPPNLAFYLDTLMGGRNFLYAYPVALACLPGLLLLFKGERLEVFCVLSVAVFYAFFSLYFYQEERLLLPAVPFVVLFGVPTLRRLGGLLHMPGLGDILLMILAGLNLIYAYKLVSTVDFEKAPLRNEAARAGTISGIIPEGAVFITGRDILFYSHMLPGRKVLPLGFDQDWVEGIAYREYKRLINPNADFKEFKEWVSRNGKLPPEEAGKTICFPAGALARWLELEISRGRKVFLDEVKTGENLKPLRNFTMKKITIPGLSSCIYEVAKPK